MNPIESPIAENYHDNVFSQQRDQPAQDCVAFHTVGIVAVQKQHAARLPSLSVMYHLPIYSRGPSWMSPWQALVAGVLCLGLGLFSIIGAVPTKKEK
jgi:hypothetical protein